MGAALRAAIVGLDTSHPDAFVPVMRERGVVVTHVLDEGVVRAPGYPALFAEGHGIPMVARTPADLRGAVDFAVVSGCDWERKMPLARELAALGIDVFLDKPACASVSELEAFLEEFGERIRVAGGSALLWNREAAPLRASGQIAGGTFWARGHAYDYGVHAIALAISVMGGDIVEVRGEHDGTCLVGSLRWEDGRRAEVRMGPDVEGATYGGVVERITGERESVQLDPAALYPALWDAALPRLRGDAAEDERHRWSFEPERVCLALEVSARDGGAWIGREDRVMWEWRWPSAAFVADYVRSRARLQ